MHRAHFTLGGRPLRAQAVDLIGSALRLAPYGRLAAARLAELLLAAASWRCTLTAVCDRLRRAPSYETARQALLANLPAGVGPMRARLADALARSRPASLRGRAWEMAVDLVLVPFYGREGTPGVARGPAKAGTKAFWAYATCMVTAHGRRYTVALTEVQNGQPGPEMLGRLREQVRAAGLGIRRWLMDRGFYSAAIVHWLQARGIPYLIPMVRRGRGVDARGRPTGTQRFFDRQGRGLSEYRWAARDGSVEVEVRTAAVRSRGKMRAFIYGGWTPGSPREALATYRRRFRIETGYRQVHRARARSASRDARVRLLWLGIAAVLRNLWAWWHDRVLAEPSPGRRRLRLRRLRLATMLEWLREAIVEDWGRVAGLTVTLFGPPPTIPDICP